MSCLRSCRDVLYHGILSQEVKGREWLDVFLFDFGWNWDLLRLRMGHDGYWDYRESHFRAGMKNLRADFFTLSVERACVLTTTDYDR